MPETITSALRTTAFSESKGRLILATCADMGRLDLLLAPAARRLSGTHSLTLAEPVVTRLLPAGSGTVISSSQFGERDHGGDIVLAWHQGAHSYGYTSSLIDILETGSSVIAAAPAGIGAEVAARALWPLVAMVHLEAGTERLRCALGRSSRGQSASPFADAPRLVNGIITVPDLPELPAAIRALCAAFECVLPRLAAQNRRIPAPCEPTASGARARLAAGGHLAPNRSAAPRLLPRAGATSARRHPDLIRRNATD